MILHDCGLKLVGDRVRKIGVVALPRSSRSNSLASKIENFKTKNQS